MSLGIFLENIHLKGVYLEKFTNNPKKVKIRSTKSCPLLLYASLNKTSNDLLIKIYSFRHRYINTIRNYMCNSNFLYKHYKDRITKQLNIRIFKFKYLIRTELGIYIEKLRETLIMLGFP